MAPKLRKGLQLLLLALFAVSVIMLARQYLDNSSGEEAYDDALNLAVSGRKEETQPRETEPPETAAPTEPKLEWVPAPPPEDDPRIGEMAAIDLKALREVNPDVIGWIRIPDTRIDYPLLQGEDNEYYLKHTWKGNKNSVGSIFMECQNTPDFRDYNTIIYGHNMNDGSMFANIRRYSARKFWEKHPYVYITTDWGVYRYEIFSSYQSSVEGIAYGLSFNQPETKAEFLVEALKSSKIDTGIQPEMTDRILTLSTCSGAGYSTRWVVHARLKMIQQEVGGAS